MAGKERFKGRKVYKGEKDAGVWKSDERWDRDKDTGPGTGWEKVKDIPKANPEGYRGRPGKPNLASFEAAYRRSKKKTK